MKTGRSTHKQWGNRWLVMGAIVCFLVLSGGQACHYESALDNLECDTDEECPDGGYCEGGFCVKLPGADRIELTPSTRTVTLGQTVSLDARVLGTEGEPLDHIEVEWESSDEGIVEIDSDGTAIALEVGTALVTARAGAVSAATAIIVSDVAVAEVIPSSTEVIVEQGRHEFVAVEVRDEGGAILSDRGITWHSDDPTVVAVSSQADGTGVISARATGQAELTVRSENAEASVSVEVTEPAVALVEIIPGELSMTEETSLPLGKSSGVFAQVFDDRATVLERDIHWQTDNESALIIAEEEGELFLRALEVEASIQVELQAVVDGVTGTAMVTVRPADVAGVALSPVGILLEQYQSYGGFEAQVLNEQGDVIDGSADLVQWESSDPTIVDVTTVNGDVVVEALGLGTAEITAAYDSQISASAFVTVVAESMDSVTVNPQSVSLSEGQSVPVSAELSVPSGQDPGQRAVVWSSAEPVVATVNADSGSNATVFGHAGGAATTVFAEVDGEVGSLGVTVEPRVLSHITIAPGDISLKEGQSVVLSATVIGDDGRSVPGEPVDWEVCDGTLLPDDEWDGCISERATIDIGGEVTTLESGQVSIRATAQNDGDVKGVAGLTVEPAPVINVEVSPVILDLIKNDPENEVGVLTYEVITINGTKTEHFADVVSSDPLVASIGQEIDQSAEVIAESPGAAIVTATADLQGDDEPAVGKAFVQVAEEPVDGLRIEAVDANGWTGSVMVGDDPVLFEAIAQLRGGSEQSVAAHWWSAEPEKVGIDDNGALRGLAEAQQVEVFAYYEGQVATIFVDVEPYAPNSVDIEWPGGQPNFVEVDQVVGLDVVIDGDSAAQCGVEVKWTSSDTSRAVVSSDGTVSVVGGENGQTVVIEVSCGAMAAETTIEIAATPTDVTVVCGQDCTENTEVEPSVFELAADTGVLEAVVEYAGEEFGRCTPVWTSSDYDAVTLDQSGALVSHDGVGATADISVDCGGVVETVPVEVVAM